MIRVDADLDLSLELPGSAPVRGTLRGSGQELLLEVDRPEAFAGRADGDAVRAIARRLAQLGVTVRVVSGDVELLALGVPRSSWLHRRLTGSPHMRVGGRHGARAALRGRLRRHEGPVLPGERLLPPSTPVPLAPTFLRRPRTTVTTTHDPLAGGQPRLVVAPGGQPSPGGARPRHHLRDGTTTIGSADSCDITLAGLDPVHAEIRHDERDEFVLVARAGASPVRVNGQPVDEQPLRTGARVELGGWTLSYYREEYADHGRPYGGRIGGELGHQRPQPPRPQRPAAPTDDRDDR